MEKRSLVRHIFVDKFLLFDEDAGYGLIIHLDHNLPFVLCFAKILYHLWKLLEGMWTINN